MSDLVLRDKRGFVISRYADPGELRPHHDERKPQISDVRRMALIKAERELLALWIVAEHLDLSDIAMTRISDALESIRRGLEVKRRELGMSVAEKVSA